MKKETKNNIIGAVLIVAIILTLHLLMSITGYDDAYNNIELRTDVTSQKEVIRKAVEEKKNFSITTDFIIDTFGSCDEYLYTAYWYKTSDGKTGSYSVRGGPIVYVHYKWDAYSGSWDYGETVTEKKQITSADVHLFSIDVT